MRTPEESTHQSKRRPVWSRIARPGRYIRNGLLYARSVLSGESYVSFYERMMDGRVRAGQAATGSPEYKQHQLEFLKAQGLRPSNSLLDYGCGTGAAGVHFIRYLNPALYVGVDLSSECIRNAQQRILDENLETKGARFLHLPRGDLSAFPERKFDFVWAHSVLTHLPPDVLQNLLGRIQRYMGPHTIFYATFASAPGPPKRKRLKDWFYDPDDIRALARLAGLGATITNEWKPPPGQPAHLTMAKFSLPPRNAEGT